MLVANSDTMFIHVQHFYIIFSNCVRMSCKFTTDIGGLCGAGEYVLNENNKNEEKIIMCVTEF